MSVLPDDPTVPPDSDVVVFSSDDRRQTMLSSIREAWKFRSFILYMTRRDLRTTYLRSYLGWVWSLINPIAEIAIYSIVFGIILSVDRQLPAAPDDFSSFPHYLMAGMVIWNFYRGVSSKVLNNFTATVRLRRKLYFPPVAPALSQTLTTLVQSVLELIVLVLFFGVFGHLSITIIVIVPAALLSSMFGLGIGLLLSVANTRYRDVGYLYGIFLRLFFYLIPIIWPIEFVDRRIGVPALRAVVRWNPMAKLIEVSRDGAYLLQWPPLTDWLYVSITASAVLVIGWTVFARSSAEVAEGL